MYTENSIGLLFRKELDEALAVKVRLCSRVGGKRELSDIVLNTRSFEVLLGLPHPGNLGVSVDNRRNAIVVDVTVSRFEIFDSGNTFLLSLVRKHGAEGDVTDTLDVLHGSVELVIDDDPTLVVFLNTNGFEVKTLRVRTTTDRNQHDVGFELK